jgi:DNA-binding LytR/AlgR family response regulator
VLSILAVDDERPSLDELSYLLRLSDLVGPVSVAQNASEALRILRNDRFDVVLLDIRMPGLDGLELARVIGGLAEPPEVVFVTAHEEHALEAFDVGASGYLLKPLDQERLDRVLRRVIGPGEEEFDTVPVESAGRTILVSRHEISWVEASGDYVRLHLRDGPSYLLRTSMSVLEEKWTGFVRIHRTYLVSVHDIQELRFDGARTSVRVAGSELPVSRRHLRELRDRLVRQARPGAR